MLRLTPILSLTLTVTAIAASLWCTQSDWSNAEEPASAPSGDESVDVRLARAHAELARLDLRNALETNERIPNLFSADYIERLRLHVVNDEAQLEQTLKGEEADPHQICIRTAEAAVEFAGKRRRGDREAQPGESTTPR